MNKFLLLTFVVLAFLVSLSRAAPMPGSGEDDDDSCEDEQFVGDVCGVGKTCQRVKCDRDSDSDSKSDESSESNDCELVCKKSGRR